MGKKPEAPPIDLSAKKVISSPAPVVAAPPVAMAPVKITPAQIAPVEITAVAMNGAKVGITAPEEAVRIGAYLRWDAAGRPNGDGVHFWLEAEQEILAGGAINAQECLQRQ